MKKSPFLIMIIMMGFCFSCSDKNEENPAPSEYTYFFAGDFQSANALPGAFIQTADGGFLCALKMEALQMKVYKFDNSFNLVWKKEYPDYISSVRNVVQTKDGNYVIAASLILADSTGQQAILLKIDQSGEVVWKETFIKPGSESVGNSVKELSDGSLLFHVFYQEPEVKVVIKLNESGDSTGLFPVYLWYSEDFTKINPGKYLFKWQQWIAMCDTLGNKLWMDNFNSYLTNPNFLKESDGTIIICDNGWDEDSTMREYIDFRKYAEDGTHTSTPIDLGYEHEFPSALTETPQGEKIICGWTTGDGHTSWFIIKTDTAGKLLAKKIDQNLFKPASVFWKDNQYICFGFSSQDGTYGMLIRKGTL